jgi:hypothetical protein
MKLRTKLLLAASMLPVMANAYYVGSACGTTAVVANPVYTPVVETVSYAPVYAPVVETVNYAPATCNVCTPTCYNGCAAPVQQNMAPAQAATTQVPSNYAPVSNYNTQQYYTPVVQTTVGFYR